MKPDTLEWIEKAEEDWVMGLRGYRARKNPSYNAACFHAQQCAEKYFKAKLIEAGIPVARTHNLVAFILLLLPIEPNWRPLQPLARTLNVYAVDYRYPGNTATKLNAKEAIAHCREIRKVVRLSFSLSV